MDTIVPDDIGVLKTSSPDAYCTSPAEQKQLARVAAAEATSVAEFGERFFREIVAKDRQNLTSPRRYFDKLIVPSIGQNVGDDRKLSN